MNCSISCFLSDLPLLLLTTISRLLYAVLTAYVYSLELNFAYVPSSDTSKKRLSRLRILYFCCRVSSISDLSTHLSLYNSLSLYRNQHGETSKNVASSPVVTVLVPTESWIR